MITVHLYSSYLITYNGKCRKSSAIEYFRKNEIFKKFIEKIKNKSLKKIALDAKSMSLGRPLSPLVRFLMALK